MKNIALLAVACSLGASLPAAAQHIDWAVRTTLAFEADGPRDLGLADEEPSDNNFFLSLAPRAIVELSPNWTGYVRGRVFLPTGRVAPFDSGEPDDQTPSRAYAGVNELWIQYGGFTSYPGEALRLGRQHIRQVDNNWWDQDTDALRWILDTTLLDAEIGVAHAFSAFRSDGADVPPNQRDRTYYFGQIAGDWHAGNRIGLRAVHTTGGVAPEGTRLASSELTWAGVFFENGFYDILGTDHRLAYSAAATYLTGRQQLALETDSQNIRAWQANMDLRLRLFKHFPLFIGGGYTWSEPQFQQTGMQSNSSYFTGTNTLIGRYNETLQAELGNLRVATGFVSLDLEDDEASLIFSKFTRDDGLVPIITSALSVDPVTDSRDIGMGVDLVFTHHFSREQRHQRLLDRGDAFTALRRGSLISLRASAFKPGDAYGPDARTDYRILLEGTLWID
jgi:alginate production protein